jgi:hypothetical protein
MVLIMVKYNQGMPRGQQQAVGAGLLGGVRGVASAVPPALLLASRSCCGASHAVELHIPTGGWHMLTGLLMAQGGGLLPWPALPSLAHHHPVPSVGRTSPAGC